MGSEPREIANRGTRVTSFRIVEASIAELRAALDDGIVTSVELVALHLNRIAHYDRHGIRLNAVPVLNPDLFADAREADERRSRGESLGPLDGIPYVAKDSYAVKGLTVAAGSPAFERLVAQDDAFVIARLRAAGAILIGLTNMPPMAAGGMQRGLYGRAESPYNANFLAAAYASGSSNGSGTGVAASFAVFGLGEETWSSGRAPASNGGLVAYTPSRGVISVRGNWPLIPTMDVVVPYARSMADLFEILNAIVADDVEPRGDFWRVQTAVSLFKSSEVRPPDYHALRDPEALRGKRLGVPRMYINKDPSSARPIVTRASVIALWEQAASDLRALGAELVEVDFPLVSNYERDRPGAPSMTDRGLVPPEFSKAEGEDLIIFAWHDFLEANGDPHLHALAAVEGSSIIPPIPGTVPDRYEGIPDFTRFPVRAREGVTPVNEIPHLAEGLRGLEETRRIDFEDWLDANGLDLIVFPAVADVAPADADYNPRSSDVAWRNGTWVANGNQAIRHFGLPTATVLLGTMADLGMPVGVTFAGKAYEDSLVLKCAYAFEQSGSRRKPPARTPALPGEEFGIPAEGAGNSHPRGPTPPGKRSSEGPKLELWAVVSPMADDGTVTITVSGSAAADAAVDQITVFVNGDAVPVKRFDDAFTAKLTFDARVHTALHSRWRGPYGSIVMALATDSSGGCAARYVIVGGNVTPD
jgi:amidase